MDLEQALDDVTRSSGGGIAFLIAYGLTLLIAGILAFSLSTEAAALVIIFQGGVALPLAFMLERVLGFKAMAPDNPLRPLSVQLAMTQIVALPAVIITYQLNAAYVPAVLAAIAGGHFLPYAWLHRTNLYIGLSVLVSIVPFMMMAIWDEAAFPYVPLVMAAFYWSMALALRIIGPAASFRA